MPYHRSVYINSGRQRRAVGWFYLSMFASAFLLVVSVLLALPGIVELAIDLMFPIYQTGAARTETASALHSVCLAVAALSGLYLFVALGVHLGARRPRS